MGSPGPVAGRLPAASGVVLTAGADALPAFLVRAAREFAGGGWVFTGFNWPLLAGRLARSLYGDAFTQVFEAGAAANVDTRLLPTSTTDYAAYGESCCYLAETSDVLFGLARRLKAVLLDAGNVDVAGRVNSSAIGSYARPHRRLPGGGGAPEVARGARRLVLLHASAGLERLVSRLEHATCAPAEDAEVILVTPSAVLSLRPRPRVVELLGALEGPPAERLRGLGIELDQGAPELRPGRDELEAAALVLREAAGRGYVAARRWGAGRGL